MFIFLAVHLDQHPDYDSLDRKGEDATKILLNQLWQQLADQLASWISGSNLIIGLIRTGLGF